MPSLHILQGPDKGHTFELNASPALLGRGSPDVPLTDNTVSRRHSRLVRQNGRWLLSDLNSANGTFVNGVKISTTVELRPGDQVRCGTTLIVFGEASRPGVPGEPMGSLRLDEDGNIVESSIMSSVPSLDDSVIIAAPETSNAVENLRLLYELTTATSSIFDQQQLLERVVDMIFKAVPAERGFILLRPEDGSDELEPKVVRYRRQEDKATITVSQTIVHHVLARKEGVICSNAMRDPRFAKGHSVHSIGIRSALCAPIMVRDDVIGVIYVDSTVATHTYAGDQLRLLTAMGRQTGVALENARLYQAGVKAERLAAVGETVAYLSHGIKNILQSLNSASDMVNRGLENHRLDRIEQGWNIVERNLARVHNLALNMLAYSKSRKPNREMTQVNQLVYEMVDMVTKTADDKKVAVLTELDRTLPPAPLDPDGVQQVMLNLVLNALDAVEPGVGAVTVKTWYDEESHDLMLQVVDNGPGIASDQLPHIFSAFVSHKGQRGTGLGLAVVKKIVEEHNGSVKVESTLEEGTAFTVRLPVQPADAGETASQTHGDTTM